MKPTTNTTENTTLEVATAVFTAKQINSMKLNEVNELFKKFNFFMFIDLKLLQI